MQKIIPTIYLPVSVRYTVASDVQQLKVPRMSGVPNYAAIRNSESAGNRRKILTIQSPRAGYVSGASI
jgi:hypothetical protein